MLIIGLLLFAAAIVVGIDVAAMNGTSIDIEAFNHVWASSVAVSFVAGVVTALVGVVGLLLLRDGSVRSRRRRRARRAEIERRDRLAAEHERELRERERETIDLRDREAAVTEDGERADEHERHGLFHRAHN